MFVKMLNTFECHNDLQYKDGLNIDPIPFAKKAGVPGGIHFTSPKFVPNYIGSGEHLREVTIPDGAQMVKVSRNEWRADKVILGPLKRMKDVSTWKFLIKHGLDIHARDDIVLTTSSMWGYTNVVRFLIKVGANVCADSNEALKGASLYGHLAIVKLLVDARSPAQEGLEVAISRGHRDIVEYLTKMGAKNWLSFISSATNGQLMDVRRIIEPYPEYILPEAISKALIGASQNGHTKIVDYLIDRISLCNPEGLKNVMNAIYREGSHEIIYLALSKKPPLGGIVEWVKTMKDQIDGMWVALAKPNTAQ